MTFDSILRVAASGNSTRIGMAGMKVAIAIIFHAITGQRPIVYGFGRAYMPLRSSDSGV